MQYFTDKIVCIRQILEKTLEYNETVHQLFVDFKEAYDSVRREVLREEHRLRVFEIMVLRRIFGLKRDEVTESWKKNCIKRSFITYTLRQV
jgi:hypothetical protein